MTDRLTLILKHIQDIKTTFGNIANFLKKLKESQALLFQQLHDINEKLDLIANREFLADSLKERVEKLEKPIEEKAEELTEQAIEAALR